MEGCNGFTWIKDVPENAGNAKLCFAKTGDVKIIGAGKFLSPLRCAFKNKLIYA